IELLWNTKGRSIYKSLSAPSTDVLPGSRPLRSLAAWTIKRAAGRLNDASNRSLAHWTRLALTVVHTQALFVIGRAFAAAVIEKSVPSACPGPVERHAAAKVYCFSERFPQRAAQSFDLPARQFARGQPRRDSGVKERFARVNIAYARDKRLIEQFDFDRLRRPLQGMSEIFNGKFVTQRFRTQPFLRRSVEGESPEIPCVLEDEVFSAEIER